MVSRWVLISKRDSFAKVKYYPQDWEEANLIEFFSQCGPVTAAAVKIDDKGRKFAFAPWHNQVSEFKIEAAAKCIMPIMRPRILSRLHVDSWSTLHVRLEVNYENPDDAKKCVNELHGMDSWLIPLKWRADGGDPKHFKKIYSTCSYWIHQRSLSRLIWFDTEFYNHCICMSALSCWHLASLSPEPYQGSSHPDASSIAIVFGVQMLQLWPMRKRRNLCMSLVVRSSCQLFCCESWRRLALTSHPNVRTFEKTRRQKKSWVLMGIQCLGTMSLCMVSLFRSCCFWFGDVHVEGLKLFKHRWVTSMFSERRRRRSVRRSFSLLTWLLTLQDPSRGCESNIQHQ